MPEFLPETGKFEQQEKIKRNKKEKLTRVIMLVKKLYPLLLVFRPCMLVIY